MNRRDVLKRTSAVLGMLFGIGGAAVASAAPTAASDREKVEAMEDYIAKYNRCEDLAKKAATLIKADPECQRLERMPRKWIGGRLCPDAELRRYSFIREAGYKATASLDAEIRAAYTDSNHARERVRRVFGSDAFTHRAPGWLRFKVRK